MVDDDQALDIGLELHQQLAAEGGDQIDRIGSAAHMSQCGSGAGGSRRPAARAASDR